jgi:hypothetical protein
MKKLSFCLLFLVLGMFAGVVNANEVRFSTSSTGTASATEFRSGEYIYAHVKFKAPPASVFTYNGRPVTFSAEFYSGGKMLEEEMFGFDEAKVKGSKQDAIVFPVVSDPAVDVPAFGKNLFATRIGAEFGKLTPGRHEIEFRLRSYNYKDGSENMAVGKFTLIVEPGAAAWYKKNAADSYDAMVKRGVTTVTASARDVAMGVVGGTSVITLVNNCGRSVWLRKALGSDKTEYRLSPGQSMKYDRDSGYLEEWNFGTRKWGTVTKVWTPGPDGKANICQK